MLSIEVCWLEILSPHCLRIPFPFHIKFPFCCRGNWNPCFLVFLSFYCLFHFLRSFLFWIVLLWMHFAILTHLCAYVQCVVGLDAISQVPWPLLACLSNSNSNSNFFTTCALPFLSDAFFHSAKCRSAMIQVRFEFMTHSCILIAIAALYVSMDVQICKIRIHTNICGAYK